MTVHRNIFP